MRRTLTETDFLLAAFVFCASLIVSVYAYANIQEIERPSSALVSGLREGNQEYKLLFGEQCPGSINVSMAYEAVWGLRSNGQLRVSYGKALTDVKMITSAYFNPLGQLNSARFELQADGYDLNVTFTNPHPITVDIEARGNGPEYRQQFTIPGPFTIQKNGDGTYRIDYSYYALTQNPSIKALEGFLSREFKMKVVQADNAPKDCGTREDNRLNLLPLVMKSTSMLGPLYTLMRAEEFKGR